MLDPHGYIKMWNAGAEWIKGYSADEIIGKHFSTFYPKGATDIGHPQNELRIAAAEGRFKEEGWRIRKDGSRYWTSVTITALRDDSGRPPGFEKLTPELEERLIAAFDERTHVSRIGQAAQSRSRTAVEARLLKLGKIDASHLPVQLRYQPKDSSTERYVQRVA